MASGQVSPAGHWCRGVVAEVSHPHPMAVIIKLDVPHRMEHLPGQHYVVKLTADDGYSASRSYSLASAPHDPLIELYVERLDDGEVSPYLADAVEVGDELELRGPIGGWFTWDGSTPAVGVGGGTGVVPLVAMLRHAEHLGHTERFNVAVSSRTLAELPYAAELTPPGRPWCSPGRTPRPVAWPAGWRRPELAPLVVDPATYFVCGSAGFAESASGLLTDLGVPAGAIRVERFGPSG